MYFWIGWIGCVGSWTADPPVPYAWIHYDPGAQQLPMPSDLVWDESSRRLALPIGPDTPPAEAALREALNLSDGWSTTTAITFEASEALDPATVTADSVQVWEMGLEPLQLGALEVSLDPGSHRVEIGPPPGGWAPGGHYTVVIHHADGGLRTAAGEPVGPDAAFTYLLADEPLTDHPRAFPGGSAAEQAETAEALEQVRLALEPALQHAEATGLARADLSAVFSFHVTRWPELAMDPDSQRMPLPFDLLIDGSTGLVHLPPSPGDDALEADAKAVANTLRGFSVSADLSFEATADLDPRTVTEDTVQLWDLSQTPVRIPAAVSAWREQGLCDTEPEGCVYVQLDPEPLPLDPGTTYAVVVTGGITDVWGEPLQPMPIGHLLKLPHPLIEGGVSQIGTLSDEQAAQIEPVRAKLQGLFETLERGAVVAAWPFTTMDRTEALRQVVSIPEQMGYDAAPTVLDRGPANQLFGSDPLSDLFPGLLNPADVVYLPRVDGVAEVIEGTIPVPIHLDPTTRRWREPPVIDDVHFLATIPQGIPADEPVPVVIFGHAVVTDRRFLLTIAGELAQRGFAAISIDLPYHGERIHCVEASLVAVPNFFPELLQPLVGFTDTMIWMPPCASGDDATCSPTGECLGPNGQPEPFSSFPIVDIRPASGAAFLDVHDLPHIPDHFRQALVDLGALRYSLQSADWSTALGRELRTDRFLYAGQSLGGILGSVYVASDPHIARAVLNVPGANLVDLFIDSTFFGPQMDEYLDSIDVEVGTWEHERLLNIARWLIDSVDPHTVAHVYPEEGRAALIQMDRINDELGDIVIPNHTTETLAEVSGLPVIEYPSVLHGDLVIPLIGDQMLEDLADFLAEGDL